MYYYDCIVIGGGHAGIEAAAAASRRGLKTTLITFKKKSIGCMPCNPSIGGSAKGIVVRDISVLGGIMPQIADKSLLQIKMLNKSKGPAVWSLRAQIDINVYSSLAVKFLDELPNLEIIECEVIKILIKNNKILGVEMQNHTNIYCNYLIITTGTYLNSTIHRGEVAKKNGPNDQLCNNTLSLQLKSLGFKIQRLKTGTPPRINRASVNFSKMIEEKGDKNIGGFSVYSSKCTLLKELSCFLTYIEDVGINIITDNLSKSALYSGKIEGVGPRYCPSIEDKIVRFTDKQRHQVFIEPISLSSNLLYVQGLSTSLPDYVQEKFIHTIKGLEECKIVYYGYAIEYDSIDPQQLYPTLESKLIKNLFFAGQINGTSGYEEAAAQGLVAAINVANDFHGMDKLILKRDESYIGVMIDDLVTKGVHDPYRLLTSRAEFRLMLRHDNALYRLSDISYMNKMISRYKYKIYKKSKDTIEEEIKLLKTTYITPKKNILRKININIYDRLSLFELLKKRSFHKKEFLFILECFHLEKELEQLFSITDSEWYQIILEAKYEGYIRKNIKEIKKLQKMQSKIIPQEIDYTQIPNLSLECVEKLQKIRPLNIGQALRIPGINTTDVMMLDMFLRRKISK